MSANISLALDENIRTVKDALTYLNLSSCLNSLDKSLEDVRRNRKSISSHQLEFETFDTKIQELLTKFHHDELEGSLVEMSVAKHLYVKLCDVRYILNTLNKIFLENVNMDHRYDYYIMLDINSLKDEIKIHHRVCEVSRAINSILEVKYRKIIPEIRQFLIEGKNCVKWFLKEKMDDYFKCQDMTRFHLNKCIEGHEELLAQIDVVKGRCIDEKKDYICHFLERMKDETFSIVVHLKKLKEFTDSEICRSFGSTYEQFDYYYVVPFAVYYIIIFACNAVIAYMKNFSEKLDYGIDKNPDTHYSGKTFLQHMFDVVLKLQKNSFHQLEATDNGKMPSTVKEAIKEFLNVLSFYQKSYLEKLCKVTDYENEFNPLIHLLEKHEEFMKMLLDSKMNEETLKIDNTKLKNDITKLNDDITKLNNKNTKLNDENLKLKNDNKKLNDDNTKLNAENSKLKDDNKKTDDVNTKLNVENVQLKNDNTILNNDYARVKDDNAKLSYEIAKLNDENLKLKNDNKKLNDDNAKLNGDNTKLVSDNAELTDEIRNLYYENSKLKIDNEKLNDDIIKLNNNNEKITDDITKLNNDNTELIYDIRKLFDANLKLKSDNSNFEKDNKNFMSRIEELEHKYEEVVKQIEEFHRNEEEECSEQRKLHSTKETATLRKAYIQTL